MTQPKRGFQPAIGGASMLVIIAVLCLTVFAMLSITDAQTELRLGDAAEASVTGYYAADGEAERILALLRSGSVPEGVTRDGDIYSYTCPISDSMQLAVRVELHGRDYTVLQWQALPSTQWENDESINLWNGNTTGD